MIFLHVFCLQKRGEVKGSIVLNNVVVVATVNDGALDGHKNAFQVGELDTCTETRCLY